MQGITNAPQGGSGGEWTVRAANNDWSDMFEVVNSKLVTKCEIFIYHNLYGIAQYLPKGLMSYSSHLFIYGNYALSGTHYIITRSRMDISTSNYTGSGHSAIPVYGHGFTFTTDGSEITVTENISLSSANVSKSAFTILTR